MLRTPRRLPQRYNRRVSPQTRSLVARRHARRRNYRWERLRRLLGRIRRQWEPLKAFVLRFIFVFVAGIVVLVIGIVLFSPLLNVREVRVARTDPRIDIERVERLLKPLFGKHLLFLSSSEVYPLLKNGLPAVKDTPAEPGLPELLKVNVGKRYPSTIVLELTLEPLIARLDLSDPTAAATTNSGSTADFLTSQGIYVNYAPNQVGSGGALPLIKVVDWSVRPVPFSPLLSPALLKTMDNAENALVDQFGQPVSMRVVYLRAQEFHLKVPEYSLWFDMKSPLEAQLQRYRLFLQTIGKTAPKLYIDLRLADRVVYR